MPAPNPTLSVIVPVYNTASYLPGCLDSVLAQSGVELEVIVIDDGSTDGSWKIIQHYASHNSRLKAFRQERKRQGAARNLGLDHARGAYISFVDSDDFLPCGSFVRLLTLAAEHGSDLVIGPYQSFCRGKKWFELPVHQEMTRGGICSTDIFGMPSLLEDISVCNKLIKRSVVNENALRFPEKYAGEDVIFTSHLYLKCRSITVCPDIIYYCRRRRATASSFRINRGFFDNRKETALQLADTFSKCSAMSIYPYLVRSELRKLVGSRLARVVTELHAEEQDQVFDILRDLAKTIGQDGVYGPTGYYNAIHKISIRLLQENEKEALRAFHMSRTKILFLKKIRNPEVRREITGLIAPLYLLGAKRLLAKAV